MVIFHRDAPLTVRLGAIGAFLLAIADAAFHVSASLSAGPTLWSSVIQPLIGLSVGVMIAWGIAQLNGLAYWFWFVVCIIGFVALIAILVARLFSFSPGPGAGPPDLELVVLGLIWVMASIFLLSPSSIRTFWRKGRLS